MNAPQPDAAPAAERIVYYVVCDSDFSQAGEDLEFLCRRWCSHAPNSLFVDQCTSELVYRAMDAAEARVQAAEAKLAEVLEYCEKHSATRWASNVLAILNREDV
jgi:hypothetical protein